ncbi:MAG: tRNA (guanosine-2'-O-)-methyltransferase [Candidatus Aldehydirespiratoraceae bacterium]|jgi:tRNA (guanosine-2'-O-)-methyltransferase
MTQLDGTGMKRLHREWRKKTTGRLALILDGVQNPFNVGSIVRTAAAERVDHVWIAAGTAPDHDKVNKTALGTARYLTWTETEDGPTAIKTAQAEGYRVVAIELTSSATPLPLANLSGDVALVIGHEDRGVTPVSLAACDEVAFIPQLGKVGSLNVSAAAAIAIYEARRRSWA